MVLVIRVEDDEVVVLVDGCDVLPPCLEARGVGDDVPEEAAVVVGLDHGVFAFAGDIVDLLGQVAEVEGVEGAGEGVGGEALHDCGVLVYVDAVVGVCKGFLRKLRRNMFIPWAMDWSMALKSYQMNSFP